MNIALTTYMLLSALGLGITLAQHGEPRGGNHNFFVSLFAAVLGNGLVLLAVYGR